MNQNIWEQLESDFECQAKPVEVEVPANQEPGDQKTSAGERFAEATLSGFLPTVLLVALGLFLTGVVEQHSAGSIFEVAGVFLFIWLLRPLVFSGLKTPSWLLLAAPFVISGYTELLDSVPLALDAQMKTDKFKDYDFLRIVTQQLEGILSWSHLSAYLLAGVALCILTRKLEESYYWLDSKPLARFRRYPKLFILLVLPALALLWVAWQHPWNEKEQQWLEQLQGDPRALGNYSYSGWEATADPKDWEKLPDSLPNDPAKIVSTEKKALKLWETQGNPLDLPLGQLEASSRVLSALADQPHALKHPERVAMALLQHPRGAIYGYFYQQSQLIANSLLSYVAHCDLRLLETEASPWTLDKSVETRADFVRLSDSIVHAELLEEMGWQLKAPFPEGARFDSTNPKLTPMTLLSYKFETTPVSVYARWKARRGLKWWLEKRHLIQTKTSLEAEKAFDSVPYSSIEQEDRIVKMIYFRIDSFLSFHNLEQELVQVAQIIQALRRHRASEGSWPKDLKRFIKDMNLHLNHDQVEFDDKSNELTFTASGRRSRKTFTWSLK